jgi:hypothetical protein
VKAAWSKRTEQLVRSIAGQCRPRLQLELAHWLDNDARFQTFVAAHQDKVRKKLSVKDEEARLDARAELLVAQRMLADRRFEVLFEAFGAQSLGPDLSVTFRTNQRFNVEVTRVRGSGEIDTTKLASVIAGKLRQLPTGLANIVVLLGTGLAVAEYRLADAGHVAKTRDNGRYVRLSGVFALDDTAEPMSATFWANPEARHPLATGIVAALTSCFGR